MTSQNKYSFLKKAKNKYNTINQATKLALNTLDLKVTVVY